PDTELENAGGHKAGRAAGLDIADEAAVGLDREIEPSAREAARASDARPQSAAIARAHVPRVARAPQPAHDFVELFEPQRAQDDAAAAQGNHARRVLRSRRYRAATRREKRRLTLALP